MPQIFHRSFNTLSKVSILGAIFLLTALGWALYVVGWSPYVTQADIARVQPVPFSHEHHVGQLGIDCRGTASALDVLLLLPRGQAAALISVAEQRGLTAGQLLRRLIRDFLAIERRHAATPTDGCTCR